MVTSSLSQALKAARAASGKTAEEVAVAIGRRALTVYRWEWGKSHPHYTDLEKLAAVYGLSVGQLVPAAESVGGRS